MAKRNPPAKPTGEIIIQKSMENVLHDSMMPYSEHVILERALPRVEDGLKPVQRRILFTMHELGLTPDKPHRKCARIVGDCLGKYHPHGDSSVYEALARMAQTYSLREPLVDGHGNFGSIDGDSPAAMRYTEARMTNLAMEMLRDIDKDTVSFRLNFDDTQKEPDMLPGRFPNLLVNGASGIAVGLATNVPPHNLAETISAAIAQIDNPNITLEALMRHLPAPDFPTGGILLRDEELKTAYETGRGKLRLRARVHVEDGPSGRKLLVITEVPYQVSKSAMLEKILRLSEEKKAALGGIHDIRDESDRTGLRAVIELKRDVDPERTLAYLYKYSDMQVTFGVNMVVIAGGKPMQLGIKPILRYFIDHQKDVVTRRTKYELDEAKARAHVLEGLIIAVDNLDEVIRLIRASKNPKEAKTALMNAFALSDIQAQAILDMRLQRLTNLEILTLRAEYADLLKLIDKLTGILKSEKKLLDLIKKELSEIAAKYASPRRTELRDEETAAPLPEPEAPEAEEVAVVLSSGGFLKRMAPRVLDRALSEPDAEPPRRVLRAMSDWKLFFFTDAGACYPLGAEQIPECRYKERGVAPSGVLNGLENAERVVSVLALAPNDRAGDLIFATRHGVVKRAPLTEYDVRKARFSALSLRAGDALTRVLRAGEGDQMMLVTKGGMAIHFPLSDVTQMGRAAAGVRGIALSEGDEVVAAFTEGDEGEMLLASDLGYLKRCLMVDFEPQARGGKGLKCFTFPKNGAAGSRVVGAMPVKEPYPFAVRQKGGALTRLSTEDVRIELRAGKGSPYVLVVMDDIVEEIYPLAEPSADSVGQK